MCSTEMCSTEMCCAHRSVFDTSPCVCYSCAGSHKIMLHAEVRVLEVDCDATPSRASFAPAMWLRHARQPRHALKNTSSYERSVDTRCCMRASHTRSNDQSQPRWCATLKPIKLPIRKANSSATITMMLPPMDKPVSTLVRRMSCPALTRTSLPGTLSSRPSISVSTMAAFAYLHEITVNTHAHSDGCHPDLRQVRLISVENARLQLLTLTTSVQSSCM